MVWSFDIATHWPWPGFAPAAGYAGSAETRFCLSPAAPFLAGHFPGDPLLPGVAMMDAAMFAAAAAGAPNLAAITGARFISPVRPGQDIVVRITHNEAGACRARILADGQQCARIDLGVQAACPAAVTPVPIAHARLTPHEVARLLPQRPPMLMLVAATRHADGVLLAQGRAYSDAASRFFPPSLLAEGFFQAAGLALAGNSRSESRSANLLLGRIGRIDCLAPVVADQAPCHAVTACRPLGEAMLVSGQTLTADGRPAMLYSEIIVLARPSRRIAPAA